MWVVGEPGDHIGSVLLERIGQLRPADARLSLARQMGADRLAVTTQVTGDGRDGPPPFEQCICFHVFSH